MAIWASLKIQRQFLCGEQILYYMRKFTEYSEIKEVYDTGKYDIFYENGYTKYQVKHLGSTIYCHNNEKNMGMGAIHNFSIDKFYALEKPEPEVQQSEENSNEQPNS